MLLLRILSFSAGLLLFAVLYSLSIKAPAAVEVTSLLIWPTLALLLIGQGIRKAFCN